MRVKIQLHPGRMAYFTNLEKKHPQGPKKKSHLVSGHHNELFRTEDIVSPKYFLFPTF